MSTSTLEDPRRLAELRLLEILDTPPEPDFDDLAALAATVASSPMAAVNFVDDRRHFTKAIAGLPGALGGSVPNELSFCAAAVERPDGELVVEDTRADGAWRDHPMVSGGPQVGSYAGVAICSEGRRVGVVCAFGAEARTFTEAEREGLRALARRAEKQLALRRREAVLRNLAVTGALVDLVPAVTFVLELGDGPGAARWTFLSAQSRTLLGLDPPDGPAPLELVLDRVRPEDRPALLELLGAVRDGHRPDPLDVRFDRGDGAETWLQVLAAPAAGRAQGLLFDVTAVKRQEAELRLAHKLETVGQLAAGVAHEINTPVQYVGDTLGFLGTAFEDVLGLTEELRAAAGRIEDPTALAAELDAAEERADLPYLRERVPAALARASEGIGRVASIVAALRDFAHPSSGDMGPVDLAEVVRGTLIVTANEIRYVADVECDLDEVLPVHGHRDELQQVLVNLVVNAAHAVGDTGHRGAIVIRGRRGDGEVVVSVADDGLGIAPQDRERIFDPFFTTKDVGKGTGQGLPIARGIVLRHGGTLTFDSSPAGTTFRLALPLRDGAA